jgi:HD-like signal output (HDOD) protein
LAEKTRLHAPEDCFIGGLLHDIGIIVIAQYFKESSQRIWSLMQSQKISFDEAEKTEAPLDHAEIGGYLAQKWHLPPDLVDVIRYHHQVKKAVHDFHFLALIHLANIVATAFMYDPQTRLQQQNLHPEVAAMLGSYLDTALEWFPGISNEIDQACQFFIEGL